MERKIEKDTNTDATPVETSPLEELAKAKEAAEKELLYQRAEFDNFRKRLQREQEQAVRYANERFIGDLLGTVDLLSKALQHSSKLKEKTKEKEFLDLLTGLELTEREFHHVLTRFGVELVGKKGELFDPARHEAVTQMMTDEMEPNKVVEVVQRGCLLQGRLLKPARVVVSTPKE